MELIYCADGNRRFAELAIRTGFLYGAQLPKTIYFAPFFVDQDFKRPNFGRYLEAVRRYQPPMASVLDWMTPGQLPEVLGWAETIAPFVGTVMIVPKVRGGIDLLPRTIGGRPVRLGYSVPTKFGGTLVPYHEFGDWPVHLLGGSPIKQIRLAHFMNVVSADGNMHGLMATRYNQFFVADGSARYAKNRYWPTLREANGGVNWGDGSDKADAPYEAFSRSCTAIMAMWQNLHQQGRLQEGTYDQL